MIIEDEYNWIPLRNKQLDANISFKKKNYLYKTIIKRLVPSLIDKLEHINFI